MERVEEAPGSSTPVVPGFVDLVVIGHGGFSTVYSATQLALRRPVALKVLGGPGDPTRRLERETRALGALSGVPHVIQAHDVVEAQDGRSVLVMPLFGESIAARVRRDGPQPLTVVAAWAAQLALGLDAAHRRGISHRDIKPENVLLSPEGEAHLVDFGIAGLDEMQQGSMTLDSISPSHAPPERFTDDRVDEVAGDVYSLGSSLYFALVGRAPFGTVSDDGTIGLMRRITSDPLPSSSELPESMYRAIARAMAKDPSQRHPSATALAEDLARSAGLSDPLGTVPLDAPTTGSPATDAPTTGSPSTTGGDPSTDDATVVKDWRTNEPAAFADTPPRPLPPPATPPHPAAVGPAGVGQGVVGQGAVGQGAVGQGAVGQGAVGQEAVSGPEPKPRQRARRPALVALSLMVVGLLIGFAAMELRPSSSATGSMTVTVEDHTKDDPLSGAIDVAVRGETWSPDLGKGSARHVFEAAFDGTGPTKLLLSLPDRVEAWIEPERDGDTTTKAVTVTVRDGSVKVGDAVYPRSSPSAEAKRAKRAEAQRVLSELAAPKEDQAQAWAVHKELYGSDGTATYEEITRTHRATTLPLIDDALALVSDVTSSDPDVQAGIDATAACLTAMRAAFVEETVDGSSRVPAEPAATFESRRRAADEKEDHRAMGIAKDACDDPRITALSKF